MGLSTTIDRVLAIRVPVGVILIFIGIVFEICVRIGSCDVCVSNIDSWAINSFLLTIGLLLISWKIIPEAYNKLARMREPKYRLPSITEYLGNHPYVAPFVVGFAAVIFMSFWASVRKLGLIFRNFLEFWDVSHFILETISLISLLLLGYLSYSLILAVKSFERGQKERARKEILSSALVTLALGILIIVPQITDLELYLRWPSHSLILILGCMIGGIAIITIVISKLGDIE